MTAVDRLDLLRRMAELHGQATVARAINKSPSAINQVLHGTYQGSADAILLAVAEVYGNETVECPVLGEIPLGECAEERGRTTFRATSPIRVRLWKTCKTCPNHPNPSAKGGM